MRFTIFFSSLMIVSAFEKAYHVIVINRDSVVAAWIVALGFLVWDFIELLKIK